MNCRFCGATLEHEFIDLVGAPPSNAFLSEEQINEPEVYYPLKLYLCTACFLVQIDEYKKSADIFDSGYVYFSSYSTTWLDHAKRYVDRMIQAFRYDGTSLVIEIASNDGYLLQYFKERGIPCLGIEPAAGTAEAARQTTVASRLLSRGAAMDIEAGRRVDAGEVLVGLDESDLRQRLDQAQANLSARQAMRDRAEDELTRTERSAEAAAVSG